MKSFTVTKRLRKWAAAKLSTKADATDREVKQAIGQALLAKKLSVAKLKRLTAERVPAGDPPPDPNKKTPSAGGPLTREDVVKLARGVARKEAGRHGTGLISPAGVFNKSASIRVKEAADHYGSDRKSAFYPERCQVDGSGSKNHMAGKQATYGGRPLFHPSDKDVAVSGAYVKYCINQSMKDQTPSHLRMTDHDRELFMYALHHCEWSGMIGGIGSEYGASKVKRQKLNELQIKALLDDTISGGIEVSPVVFDDAIVLFPVLYGELFPFVNVKPITRGRRVKSGVMNLPDFTSGTSEGTAIVPFNTAGFITAFDTAVFAPALAMQIGLDFEEDTPIDIGNTVIELAGLKALAYLDRVIAVGNGISEPQGIFTASGTIAVSSDNGPGGPPTVSDYEALMFAIPKEFRNEPGAVPVYVSCDTNYRRAVGIPVSQGDERRVFGMNHGDYTILQRPYKVQNGIPNNKIAYVNLRRYRMYRRLGMNVRVEQGGMQLALSNTKLLVIRMRWGGQLETGNACAVMQDAQLN